MTKQLLADMKKLYGLTVKEIFRFGKSVNATYKLITKDGEYFLKELYFFKGTKKEHFFAQVDIVLHMKKKGLDVLTPLQTKTGGYVGEINNRYYLLYSYHEIDAPLNNDDRLNFAAKTLANFHEAMKDFETKYEVQEKSIEKDVDTITLLTEEPKTFHSASLVDSAKKLNIP